MTWGAVAGAVIGGAVTYLGNKKGTQATTDASTLGIQVQQQQYDQSRRDMLPFLQNAYGAMNQQNAILGGDYSGFLNSPDYKARVDQGLQMVDRSAASKGRLYSGRHDADLVQFGQGQAAQGLNDYWSKLAGMAGQGFSASNSMGQLGANNASGIAGLLGASGQARASSYQNNANNLAGLAGVFGNAYANRRAGQGYY